MRILIASAVGVVLAAGVGTPAAAQTAAKPAAAASSTSGPARGSLEGGVDFGMRTMNGDDKNTYKSGFYVGGSMHVTSVINIIAMVGGDYQSRTGYTANIYTYSGGVRFESTSDTMRVKPFIQALLGGSQDNGTGNGISNHYMNVTPGGGVDLGLGSSAAIRVRLDFPLFMTFGPLVKATRISAGLVYNIH
jgi:hypothetical protein